MPTHTRGSSLRDYHQSSEATKRVGLYFRRNRSKNSTLGASCSFVLWFHAHQNRVYLRQDATGNLVQQWYPANIRILSMDLIPTHEMQLAIVGLQCSTLSATTTERGLKPRIKPPVYQIMIHSLLTRETQKLVFTSPCTYAIINIAFCHAAGF